MTLSKELLDKLACPRCRGILVLTEGGRGLACAACDLLYDIPPDGMPALIVERATPLNGATPGTSRT